MAARVEALNRHELALASPTSKDTEAPREGIRDDNSILGSGASGSTNTVAVPPLPAITTAAAALLPPSQPSETLASVSTKPTSSSPAALPQATAVVPVNGSDFKGGGGDSTWRFLAASFSQIDLDIWRTKVVKVIFTEHRSQNALYSSVVCTSFAFVVLTRPRVCFSGEASPWSSGERFHCAAGFILNTCLNTSLNTATITTDVARAA